MNKEIEDNEEDYNREKTLAVLTGLICMCVSFGGTALGSYHAIVIIGVLAGILATACYIIADLVVYWAARIDYKESGNAMEWTSWTVKYFLSFYLLFSGGCVAYILFNDGSTQNNREAAANRAQKTFRDCVKSGAKQSICQKQYDAVLKTESNQNEDVVAKGRVEWVEKFVMFPLFNYIPGILGLCGAVILTFVAKVTSNKKQKKKLNDEANYTPIFAPNNNSRFQLTANNAPLRVSSAHQVEQNGYYLTLSQQGEGVAIRWRKRGEQTQHVIRVTNDVAEKNCLETLDYVALAKWSLKTLRENGKESKPIYRKIEESLQ